MQTNLSPSHRAVLSIANIQLTNALPEDFAEIFTAVNPEDFVRIAQGNHIHALTGRVLLRHPELQNVLPRDLILYLVEMYRANQDRLQHSQRQLKQIGEAFADEGIPAIVMKGGGDVLDPLHDDPAIRFSGDLDILVQEQRADRAEEVLVKLGAQSLRQPASSSNETVSWRGEKYAEHHLPKIVHADWLLPVEIHILSGRGPIDRLLPVPDLFARKVAMGDRVLSVMNPEDRSCHLIAHANHHRGGVDLRAWIDWSALRERCNRDVVGKRLAQEGLEKIFMAFETMADFLETPVSVPNGAFWNNAEIWPLVRNFADTKSRRQFYIYNLVKSKFGAVLKSRDYRNYVLENMMKLDWWKQVWITHKTKRRNLR